MKKRPWRQMWREDDRCVIERQYYPWLSGFNNKNCYNCGTRNKSPQGKMFLYEYRLRFDRMFTSDFYPKGLFCSSSCFRAYR